MTFECEVTPLPGRESEFAAVLSFINDRMHQTHHKALFIFGACGCGKTSTTLRALRAVSDKPLNIDGKDKSNAKSISQSVKTVDVVSTSCNIPANKESKRKEKCNTHSTNRKTPTKPINRKRQRSEDDECCEINVDDDINENINVCKSETKQQGLENSHVVRESYESNKNSSPRSSTDSLNAAATRKSRRMEEEGATLESKNNSESVDYGSKCTITDIKLEHEPESKYDYKAEYPFLFDEVVRGRRRLQGYYVNCADLNAVQLIEAIINSMKRAFPRADGHTRELMSVITSLKTSRPCSSSSSSLPSFESHSRFTNRQINNKSCTEFNNVNRTQLLHKELSSSTKRRQVTYPPFHVLVLDEVELARLPAKNVLTALSLLSFERASQLALIFISNQRELVHVPAMLLQELPFTAYSINELKKIAVKFVQEELHYNKQKTEQSDNTIFTSNCSFTKNVKCKIDNTIISPSVYELVARRALLNHSGDVRKLACMCKLIVQVANDENTSCEHNVNTKNNCKEEYSTRRYIAIIEGNYGNTQSSNEPCENNGKDDSNGRSSTISNTSTTSSSSCSSFTEAGAVNSNILHSNKNTELNSKLNKSALAQQTSVKSFTQHTNANLHSASSCITLARSVQALKQSAMENQIHRHIAAMPEQILYILSCLVILTLRGQAEQRRAATSVSGVMPSHSHGPTRSAHFNKIKLFCSSSSSSSSSSLYSETDNISTSLNGKVHESVSLTTRQVHQLYTSFMGERRFPSMNATSVQLAIDNLADLGILTRPVRRGSDCAFCFNGTWSLQSIEDAITLRGEALQKEMAACGLDDSENKFVSALSDLKRLAHITS